MVSNFRKKEPLKSPLQVLEYRLPSCESHLLFPWTGSIIGNVFQVALKRRRFESCLVHQQTPVGERRIPLFLLCLPLKSSFIAIEDHCPALAHHSPQSSISFFNFFSTRGLCPLPGGCTKEEVGPASLATSPSCQGAAAGSRRAGSDHHPKSIPHIYGVDFYSVPRGRILVFR